MAIIKALDTEFGVPATYWNVGAYNEDFRDQTGSVSLYGYASAAARLSGKQPLASGQFQLSGDEYEPDMSRTALYALVKMKPEFEGAEDV